MTLHGRQNVVIPRPIVAAGNAFLITKRFKECSGDHLHYSSGSFGQDQDLLIVSPLLRRGTASRTGIIYMRMSSGLSF